MTPTRERLLLVAATAAGGVLALATATQTWAVVTVRAIAAPLIVPGQAAAPVIAPVAVTVLAAAGALTIAGPIARRMLGVVLLLLGAVVVAAGIPVVADPLASARGSVTAATGQGGARAVADAVSRIGTTPWPAVAVVAGVAVAACGVLVLWRARRWPAGGRRYRAEPAAVTSTDPIDEWDAMTRGADPTSGPPAVGDRGRGDGSARSSRGTDGPEP